jgi:hypothetical protein
VAGDEIDATTAAIAPLAEQLRTLTVLCEIETFKLLRNELQPLLQPTKEEPPADADEVIREVREKMLETLCDLRVKGSPQGIRAWEAAVRNARRNSIGKSKASPPPPPDPVSKTSVPVIKREPVDEDLVPPLELPKEKEDDNDDEKQLPNLSIESPTEDVTDERNPSTTTIPDPETPPPPPPPLPSEDGLPIATAT